MYSCYTFHAMKMDREHMAHQLHNKFGKILNLSAQIEKTPRTFGTDELLTASEIHLIEMIGSTQDSPSVTDLAHHMNVTKGAVSQSLKKLEKKGLTRKEPDPENLSRAIVELTSKGQVAFYAHKHWHETMDGGFKAYFEELEDEKLELILEFMTRVETFLGKLVQT